MRSCRTRFVVLLVHTGHKPSVRVQKQKIGDEQAVIDRMINLAVEEVLKAAIAPYTAEEIIAKRSEVKAVVDQLLLICLANYQRETWPIEQSLQDRSVSQQLSRL